LRIDVDVMYGPVVSPRSKRSGSVGVRLSPIELVVNDLSGVARHNSLQLDVQGFFIVGRLKERFFTSRTPPRVTNFNY